MGLDGTPVTIQGFKWKGVAFRWPSKRTEQQTVQAMATRWDAKNDGVEPQQQETQRRESNLNDERDQMMRQMMKQ